jgi:hypothetical protein
MAGLQGRVQIRCGPPEYHAEILVYSLKDQERWNLAELMSIESIRNLIIQNRRRLLRGDRASKPKLTTLFISSSLD